jgi:hypothetical protein
MQQINEKSHYSTLISSLNKEYKKTKLAKVLTPNDIYLLDVVYNLLQGCCLELSDKEIQKLLKIYNDVLFNSKVICNNNYQEVYQMSDKNKFIQAEKTDCNNYPSNANYIYYWQEDNPSVTISDITGFLDDYGFIFSKEKDTKQIFSLGKDISYISIGRISFAIEESLSTDNYILYDYLNNDVTEGFTKVYIESHKTLTYISNNIYANGIMNFKIKKEI